jgi:hypothetical protein
MPECPTAPPGILGPSFLATRSRKPRLPDLLSCHWLRLDRGERTSSGDTCRNESKRTNSMSTLPAHRQATPATTTSAVRHCAARPPGSPSSAAYLGSDSPMPLHSVSARQISSFADLGLGTKFVSHAQTGRIRRHPPSRDRARSL